MLLRSDEININVITDKENIPPGKIPLVFLHGFSGNAHEWDFVSGKIRGKYFPVSIDLIGHGKSSVPADASLYSYKSQVKYLRNLINFLNADKIVLTGYSMGGRLALLFTLEFPELIEKLILESTTAGIITESERNTRIKSDEKLADFILENGVERFVNYWLALPLFDSLKNIPAEKYEHLKLMKLRNNKIGLANTLKSFGTGKMPQVWGKLKNLNIPTLLITGALDKKFTELNKKMVRALPNAEHKIVNECGHNVHIEKSEEFIILVNEFLSNN